jgi:hypothetical protein
MFSNILISIMLISLGTYNLINGADWRNRFYKIDDVVIRILGVFLIVGCIGLIFRKKLGRTILMLTCILSFLDAVITFNYLYSNLEIAAVIISFAVVFIGPLVYLLHPRVKDYFYTVNPLPSKQSDNDSIETSSKNGVQLKHSTESVASFVLSLANILAVVMMTMIDSQSNDIRFIIGFGLVILAIVTFSIVGLFLGITSIRRNIGVKSLAVWGVVINGFIAVIFLLLLLEVFVFA